MPLLDHFHPPLSQTRKWEGFHSQWARSPRSSTPGCSRPITSPLWLREVEQPVRGDLEAAHTEARQRSALA